MLTKSNDIKPWLITLPKTLGDMICSTVTLNKVIAACNGKRDLWIGCQKQHIPLLKLFYPYSRIVCFWETLDPLLLDFTFEWIIDCARTETGSNCTGIKHTNYISWNYDQDNTIIVNENSIPAPFLENPAEASAPILAYPCWLTEAIIASYVLQENVWDWVNSGLQPQLKADNQTGSLANNKQVVIAPNGTFPLKKYPEASWAEVIQWFVSSKWDVHILLGPLEVDGYRQLQSIPQATVHDSLSLVQVVALYQQSQLVISNDCGPMHLSAALGRPTIAIFGPTNPSCWFCYSGNGRHYLQTEGYDMWSVQAKADANPIWEDWPSPQQVINLASEIIIEKEIK